MSVVKSSARKTAWVGTLVLLVCIWSLYSLELHIGSRAYQAISKALPDSLTSRPKNHPVDTSGTSPTEAPSDFVQFGVPLVVSTGTRKPPQSPTPSTEPQETQGSDLPPPATFQETETHPHRSARPLILFAYSETETARTNLEFFISHGLHAAADFIFILNGQTDAAALIPIADNIRYVHRPNDCYDIGAYAEVLTKDDLYKRYSKFIMLNASIRGPFIPYWAEACWSDMYLRKVTAEVKLVGMTANCWPSFHVQSMIWATDSIGLNILLFPPKETIALLSKKPAFDPVEHVVSPDALPPVHGINSCFHTWGEAVAAEIGASALIEAAGYRLDVMMSAFHGNDKYERDCDSTKNGDVLWQGKYFGTNVHPFETVFLKSNRDIDPVGLERFSEWTKGRGYSSYDYCSV